MTAVDAVHPDWDEKMVPNLGPSLVPKRSLNPMLWYTTHESVGDRLVARVRLSFRGECGDDYDIEALVSTTRSCKYVV